MPQRINAKSTAWPIGNIPTHLAHKPIIACPYQGFEDEIDAKYLSVGRATYDASKLSMKVFRQTSGRWARGADIPATRLLNGTILLLGAALDYIDGRDGANATTLAEEWIDRSGDAKQVIDDWLTDPETDLVNHLDEIESLIRSLKQHISSKNIKTL